MKNKRTIWVEKETIVTESLKEKVEKTTVRVFVTTEGKTRSIIFTVKQFEDFKKEINKITF